MNAMSDTPESEVSRVRILVGCPGSGKTSLAEILECSDWVVAERDRIREELYGPGRKGNEDAVTAKQRELIGRCISEGRNVVISDTNINPKTLDSLKAFVKKCGANAEVTVLGKSLLHSDVVEANDSDHRRARGHVVPMDAINSFYSRFREQYPLKVTKVEGKTKAFIFDIDGTLAKYTDRSPYDWNRVDEDQPINDVITMLHDLNDAGYEIIIMTGRDSACREKTKQWLRDHNIPVGKLLMRKAGSNLKDSAVKHDLFHEFVDGSFNVVGVFDDRQQVVDMWRSMGLRCYQVAPGLF